MYEMQGYGSFGDTTETGVLNTGAPGGTSIIPVGAPGGSGLSPAGVPGGSGLSPAGGLSPSGGLMIPPGVPWGYAPIIIYAMQVDPTTFTTVAGGDVLAWRRFVLGLMLKSGILDPGRTTEAEGAALALSQAYAWFAFQDNWFAAKAQAVWQAWMQDLLHHDIVAISVYQAAHPDKLPGITLSSGNLSTLLGRGGYVWLNGKWVLQSAAPPPAAAAPAASSSTALLAVGAVGVLGLGWYLLA